MIVSEYRRLQKRAITVIQNERQTGRLPGLSENNIRCVDCGKKATAYDHRDYRKPLVVEPVCNSCNVLRGPALPHHRAKSHRVARVSRALVKAYVASHFVVVDERCWITPKKVHKIIMANGGWQGRLAIRAKLYRQKVHAWRRIGGIPDVWLRVLRRFKAFREENV